MEFNQTNNNKGDVNNAISEKGNVVQTTGSTRTGDVNAAASSEKGNVVQTSGADNRVQVDHPKVGFWSQALKRLGSLWNWIKALFTGGA
jgi:YbbR domain-containing protein